MVPITSALIGIFDSIKPVYYTGALGFYLFIIGLILDNGWFRDG